MSSDIVDIGKKLFPKERFPLLYRLLHAGWRIYARAKLAAGFKLWRLYSNLRYGENRWVRSDWGSLFVKSSDVRAYRISQTGGTQKEIVNTWSNMSVFKPDLYIDVGANYGEFTAAIAGFGIPTLTIEANPTLIDCLKTSFAPNSNVSVIHAALSDKDCNTSFYFNPQYSGSASFSEKMSTSKIVWGQKQDVQKTQVQTLRLDSLVTNHLRIKPKSMILKIDVEAFELAVFRGAFPLFKECDWWRMIIEFNPGAIRKTNGNTEEVWKTYRNFPGLVIGNHPITHEKSSILRDELPVKPPSSPCDVLIGQGTVSISQ